MQAGNLRAMNNTKKKFVSHFDIIREDFSVPINLMKNAFPYNLRLKRVFASAYD